MIILIFFSRAIRKRHPQCLSRRSGSSFVSIFALPALLRASLLCRRGCSQQGCGEGRNVGAGGC